MALKETMERAENAGLEGEAKWKSLMEKAGIDWRENPSKAAEFINDLVRTVRSAHWARLSNQPQSGISEENLQKLRTLENSIEKAVEIAEKNPSVVDTIGSPRPDYESEVNRLFRGTALYDNSYRDLMTSILWAFLDDIAAFIEDVPEGGGPDATFRSFFAVQIGNTMEEYSSEARTPLVIQFLRAFEPIEVPSTNKTIYNWDSPKELNSEKAKNLKHSFRLLKDLPSWD